MDVEIEEGLIPSELTGADIHPDAEEIFYDGIDQNCDGANDFDQDGDSYTPTLSIDLDTRVEGVISIEGTEIVVLDNALPSGDCWDLPNEITSDTALVGADINPEVTNTWYDGVDADCAGDDDFDQDGDSYISEDYPEQPTVVGREYHRHIIGCDGD